MNLLIHDRDPQEWEKIKEEYAGWTVVSEDRPIRPCVGCFGCWNRTPGECVVKDGFEKMGALIHHAEEVVVISRYTYGGFSGFVKNVFDRSLSYVLPQFEIINGETHHKKRYDEDKAFTFIFYGRNLTEEEKESAKRYVRSVCTNLRGLVKEVIFREEPAQPVPEKEEPAQPVSDREKPAQSDPDREETAGHAGRTVLLIGSMRGRGGNSGKLADQLAKTLSKETEILTLKGHEDDPSGLAAGLEDAETIVFCIPLYVDGLPAQVIRLMEAFEEGYRGGAKKIYLLANMGLYESKQLCNLFSAVKQWCEKMGFFYGGGLGISAGEMIGVMMQHTPFGSGTTKKIAKGMKQLAGAVNKGEATEDIYAEPYAFPRLLYIAIANAGWKKMAKANGINPAELYRRY